MLPNSTILGYQSRYEDMWKIGKPVRGNASDYVETQSLSQFTIRPPIAGLKRIVLAYVKNKYHGGEDGKIFQRYLEYYPGSMYGLFVISTFPVFFGCEYVVRVIDSEQITGYLHNVEFEVRSQRSLEEQTMLINSILKLVDPDSMVDGKLFRDIDLSHHPELIISGDTISGILRPRNRTKSGHPTNIAFNRAPILHFSTCDSRESWYAQTRVYIPLECIFDDEMGLLLTGMHCYDTIGGAHYVDLMLAKIGSKVYNDLIKDGARKLDIRDNPFFTYNPETDEIKCASKLKLREGQITPTTLVVEITLAEKDVHLIIDVRVPIPNARYVFQCQNLWVELPCLNNNCKLCFPVEILPNYFRLFEH